MAINFSDNNITHEKYNPKMTIEKSVDYDCENITIGSELTYTIKIKNISNFNLLDVHVIEDLIYGLKYKLKSLRINGIAPFGGDIDLNKNSIIPIGFVSSRNNKNYDNSVIVINFKVLVTNTPTESKITNISKVNYSYKVHNNEFNESQTSNRVVTDFYSPESNCVADLLSTLSKKVLPISNHNLKKLDYTITFTNTGDLIACNICINDILNNASFNLNSLQVFTNRTSSSKPYGGTFPKIYLDKVYPKEKITISFSASITDSNSCFDEEVTNYVKLTYQYYKNNCDKPVTVEGKSNLVTTEIKKTILVSSLSIDNTTHAQAEVNKEVTYKIILKNTSLFELSNVKYNLNLSSGYSNYIQYKPNSLKIIGGTPSHLDINPNNTPIEIGTIKPNESVVIEFIEKTLKPTSTPIISSASGIYSYLANPSLPLITCYDKTNVANLIITHGMVTLVKETFSYCPHNEVGCVVKSITSAGVGDRVTYKITIKNTSSKVLENVLFNDILSSNLTYVKGSLQINKVSSHSDLEPNLELGNINPNSSVVVTFDVIVNSLPSTSNIANTACINYEYLVNKNDCTRKSDKSCTSNTLNISYADLTSVPATKVSDTPVVSRTDPAKNYGHYIVTLKNYGNVDAINVKVIDTLPNGLTFIPNSVVVTGIDKNGNSVPLIVESIPIGNPLNIENGVIIKYIAPLVTVTIKYEYSVNSDASDVVDNIASFDYSYIVNGDVINKPNNQTTQSTIFVIDKVLKVNKTVSPTTICRDETLLYSINIENLSKENINNVVLQDTLPNGTTLVPSSFTVDLLPFYINGKPITNKDLAHGVNIGSIDSDASQVAQFQVTVNNEGFSNPIINKANISYTNTTIPSQIFSSIAIATVPSSCPTPPSCNLVELSKKSFSYCPPDQLGCTIHPITIASLNEIITYQVTVKDISNFELLNILFNDNLPPQLTFVNNSLKVNGISIPSGLVSNIPIGNLLPNQTTTITFNAVVNSIPSNGLISNTACVTYDYNQGCSNCSTITNTNCVLNELTVSSPDLISSLNKYVSQVGTVENYQSLYDEIPYIIQFSNTGNADALNVILYDTIPANVGYLFGTVVVTPSVPSKNITQPSSSNPVLKIEFGTIPAGQSYEIEFDTLINPPFEYGNIYNAANLDYSYASSTGGINNKSILSNSVVSHVNTADISISKAVSASEIDINTPVTYTITIVNNGNITANNLFISDILPTFVSYIPNTLKVNGAISNSDINSGILLGSLAPYNPVTNSPIDTISFEVMAVTTPELNPIANTAFGSYTYVPNPTTGKEVSTASQSNQVLLTIIAGDLVSQAPIKESDTLIVSKTDPASNFGNYSTTLYNSGNTAALNVTVVDTLPTGLVFTPNSVVVTGVDKNGKNVPLTVNSIPPGQSLNIENGIVIAEIPPYVTVTIKFGYSTAPGSPNTIENTANFGYSYITNSTTITQSNNQTNQSTIFAVDNILNVSKTVTPTTICPNQTLLYSVNIESLSSKNINNLVLQDTLPAGTSLVPSSFTVNLKPFYINGNPITGTDLANGINIGSIAPLSTTIVQFQAVVNSEGFSNPIVNTANVSYTNGTIPSQVFSSIAIATIPSSCPMPPSCNLVDLSKNIFSYCPPNQLGCTVHPITIASLNEIVTYQVTIKDVSSFKLSNIFFNDNLSPQLTFVNNSLNINGVTIPSGLIPNLPIGNLSPNQTTTITFNAVVNSIPSTGLILNTACVTYDYNQGCSNCSTITNTNCVSKDLTVSSPDLISSLSKYVDKVGTTENYKSPDESISYIINFKNSGNSNALNVVLKDTIPTGVGYILNTVVVTPSIPESSITQPTSSNPVLTINFGTIPAGQSYKVEFDTAINPTFEYGNIYDSANLNYSYLSSTGGTNNESILSNTVVSHVNLADVQITKSASGSEVDINMPITYTLDIVNNGNINANNLFISDILPTFVSYIPNTLKVNGLPNSSDINSGVLLGSLEPYNSITNSPIDTISFEVIATTAPEFNPIANTAFGSYTYVPDPTTGTEVYTATESNQVLLTIIAGDLISKTPIKESDTLVVSKTNPANNFGNYSTTLYNSGNTDVLNVTVVDTLPYGLAFTPNSVLVTGVDKNGNIVPLAISSIPPGQSLNIENGIIIDDIPPYVTATIKYGYTVTPDAPDTIDNIASFNYSYITNGSTITKSNVPTTQATIFVVDSTVEVTKTAAPTSVCYNQTLLYTVDIKNSSESILNNVILQDTLPNGTSLVPSSFTLNFIPFTINGSTITSSDLAQGINIGSIPIADSAVAQYMVNVTNPSCNNKNNCGSCNYYSNTAPNYNNRVPSSSIVNSSTTIANVANVSYTNGTIPSQVFTSTVVTTVTKCCSNNCHQSCKPICQHYGKSSCRPGKRQICKQIDCPEYSNYWNSHN